MTDLLSVSPAARNSLYIRPVRSGAEKKHPQLFACVPARIGTGMTPPLRGETTKVTKYKCRRVIYIVDAAARGRHPLHSQVPALPRKIHSPLRIDMQIQNSPAGEGDMSSLDSRKVELTSL